MAKKKKLKNVKLSEQELVPATIGYLNEKKSSPIFLIVVFGLFFAFLYFIPEVSKYIEQLKGTYVPPEIIEEDEKTFDQNDLQQEFNFDSESKIVLNEIVLSDFKEEDNQVTLNITNENSRMSELGAKKYYIYFKNDEDKVVDYIYLEDLLISANKTETYTYDVGYDSFSKMFVDVYNPDYIDDIILENNSLVCTSGSDTYEYYFETDKLVKETYIYDTSSTEEQYKYEKMKEKYELLEGVVVDLDTAYGVRYQVDADLNTADPLKLNNDYLFGKELSAKEINLIMYHSRFECR